MVAGDEVEAEPLGPAGATLDRERERERDPQLGYSDERLCLPSDNCSLRGRERSINQNELSCCGSSSACNGRFQCDRNSPLSCPGGSGFKM